ncbi:MAG TPA: hypothetical protein VF708_09530 [Pyrinomonadaceae bacterium]
MKRCPACNQTYTDESLSFCMNDGAPLLSIADPPPTEIYRPGPSQDNSYTQTPNWSPTPAASPQRSSALPWIIGGVIALVILGLASVFIVGLFIALSGSSSSNRAGSSNNSNYALNNRSSDDNSNSSNSNAAQQNRNVKTLDVAGIWEGTSDSSPASLVIRKSEDNSYEGVETAGTGKDEMLVKVEVNPQTRRITIREVTKLKGTSWNLGTNEGTISSDGRSMSGTAKDTKNKSYSWSFSKK